MNVTLFGNRNRVFADIMKDLNMLSILGLGLATNLVAAVLIKNEEREIRDRDTEGEGHMWMEAETGIIQARECQRLLAAPRSQHRGVEQFFHRVLRKIQHC